MTTGKHSSIPADNTIRGFLLGRLNVTEQKEFEEQLMADDRLHERLRQAEFQLADDFAGDRIDQLDRERFAKTFMLTDERRRMLAVSDALHRRFSPERNPRPALALRAWWHNMLTRPVLRFAFPVIILALLIGSVWLVTREPKLARFLPKRAPARPLNIPTPQEANHPANVAPPAHRDDAASPDGHESSLPNQGAGVITTLELSPGAPADSGQTPAVSFPDGAAGVVRLELAVEQTTSGEFQAEVLSNGNVVSASKPIRLGGNGRIEIDVQAQILNAGEYEVRLSRVGDASKQAVAIYYFRVR
ncbi:MAG TPA: hypothetical protein VIU65_03500 [Pyrinomonadaceae bacterium]